MNLADVIKIMEAESHTQICVEAVHPAFKECESLKLPPELYLHHSPFCRNHKLADHNAACAKNKHRSLQIAVLGRTFCGSCPFGVREFVQPVMSAGKLAAVCYFTLSDVSLPLPELRKKGDWLAEYIRLALKDFSADARPSAKQHDREYYRTKILRFMDRHYPENIGENDLAEFLGLNPRYCSALFLRIMGKGFRRTLTERRLHEAEIYLKLHPHLSISAIALLCGFSDGNYFCSVFRRYCGITPKEFRKS